jgi:site-specific DNA-methyltransferase (adenine-specific)
MDTLKTNVLYYGDNLDILRKYIPDNSIDLIYLDPPFSSKKDYNIIFREPTGKEPEAQIKAFEDTWHWNRAAEKAYYDIVQNGPPKVGKLIDAMCDGIGRNDVMAYLVMMTVRLLELHRVLKDTGSLYLHCDPTASHYLKLVLDQVFGPANFLNEIVWCYKERELSRRYWNRKHDVIFFYAKDAGNDARVFNAKDLCLPYSEGTLKKFTLIDEQGRRFQIRGKGGPYTGEQGLSLEIEREHPEWTYRDYLDTKPGILPRDWFADVPFINRAAKERLGYPTQKPQALLERIILASSNEGDVVLDPFCGCGTALVAAQKLNRRWIGIDITHLAINVMKKRLLDSFPGIKFEVIGEPKDFAGASALAQQNRYQFQWWALSLIGAKPLGEKRKGADKGIDGVITFVDYDEQGKNAMKRAIVSVKSGHVSVKDIRELKAIAEQNAMGIFITLAPPTREMQTEAVAAGYYHSPGYNKDYPKIQILTIEELFEGKKPALPQARVEFLPKAPKLSKKQGEQIALEEA